MSYYNACMFRMPHPAGVGVGFGPSKRVAEHFGASLSRCSALDESSVVHLALPQL